jgi:hypothetical protein
MTNIKTISSLSSFIDYAQKKILGRSFKINMHDPGDRGKILEKIMFGKVSQESKPDLNTKKDGKYEIKTFSRYEMSIMSCADKSLKTSKLKAYKKIKNLILIENWNSTKEQKVVFGNKIIVLKNLNKNKVLMYIKKRKGKLFVNIKNIFPLYKEKIEYSKGGI